MDLLAEEHDDLDLTAARRFVQRRRLGPFRTAPAREGQHNRDLAAMARAGFAFGVARKVLEET
jgi:regulatory protein